MKAITLWQPYAGAMALALKRNETRGRRCSYRGDVAIHAALHLYKDVETLERNCGAAWNLVSARAKLSKQFGLLFTRGAIICVVELYDCWETEAFATTPDVVTTVRPDLLLSDTEKALGNYGPGRFVLMTRNLRVLRKPVRCRGQQSVPWNVPPEVEAEVREQLL